MEKTAKSEMERRTMRKLRKPTVIKPKVLASAKKPVATVAPQTTSTSQQKPTKQQIDAERKLAAAVTQKNKLREKTDQLNKELVRVKEDLNMTTQERGRIQQFWRIAETQLDTEKNVTRDVEKTLFLMKTAQAQHVQKLQQRIRTLVLNAKTHRFASTQTDSHPSVGGSTSVESQTQEEMNRQKASNLLRQSDELLSAFVAELEKEKLNAQSDLKYAVVQLEQRMKEDTEMQLNRLRAENEAQLEEVGLSHAEQMRTVVATQVEQKQILQGRIDFLQNELETVRDARQVLSLQLEDAREKVADQARQIGQAQASLSEMSKEVARLQDYKKSFQRDINNVESMRKEVEKYRDLNEIVMAEFAKLEVERDQLLAEFEKSINKLEGQNRRRFETIEQKTRV